MAEQKNKLKPRSLSVQWALHAFPKTTRDDVFKLYSFVYTVSHYVQTEPIDIKSFTYLEHRWKTVKKELAKKNVPAPLDDSAPEKVLAQMAYLTHRFGFDTAWVDAFLQSMRWDLQKHTYRSLKDVLAYTYGSSEVVGLMLARSIGLPEESMKAVRLQSRAIQYIHFLRNIAVDDAHGRCYFPANDIKKYGLKNLSPQEAQAKPGMFTDFMHAELLRYATWQAEANEGLSLLPRRLRVPLQTAVDVYNWTAQQLKYNPLVVYQKKVKPPKHRVVSRAVRHSVNR